MLTAYIREEDCIGCSRCIAACPVDAIVGTHKFMHTVLLDECIGCKLCVAPCPVDCIDVLPLADKLGGQVPIDKAARANRAKQRHRAREARLQKQAQATLPIFQDQEEKRALIRKNIAEALARVAQKRQ